MVGQDYANLGSAVYWLQLAAQPLVAYCLVRLPVAKFLSVAIFCYGTVLLCTAIATNYTGLLVCRMLLGFFEAAIGPTFVAMTQTWWRRAEQANRNASWYAMNGIAVAVG